MFNTPRFTPILLISVFVISTPLAAQSILQTQFGTVANSRLGMRLAGVGDINNDGVSDYAASGGLGAVHLTVTIFSGVSGSVLYTLEDSTLGNFGNAVGAAGDINSDGFGDFIIGSPSTGPSNRGRAIIYSGATGLALRTHSGVTDQQMLGAAVAAIGDVNNDGVTDTVISSSFVTGGIGFAQTFSGATGLSLYTSFGSQIENDNGFGLSVASVGDVSGDGKEDFLVGISNISGPSTKAKLFSGSNGTLLNTFFGNVHSINDSFGFATAALGDVNRDGTPDFGATAMSEFIFQGPTGYIKVFSGANKSLLYTLSGDATFDTFGWSASAAGDADLDGFADFACGSKKGYIKVYSGSNGSTMYTITDPFPAAENQFGRAMALRVDTNNDKYSELLVADHVNDQAASNAGAVYTYSLVPAGLSHFGVGTPGCTGPELMTGNSVPYVGNLNFKLRGNKAPANSLGLVIASDMVNIVGSDPFSIFVTLHVDIINTPEVYVYDMFSDSAGFAQADDPIPNNPNLVGLTFYVQTLWYWGPAGCGLTPMHLSISNVLVATLQPAP
ncbi:MAG: integrin alpha [Planctomycetota bacterium]